MLAAALLLAKSGVDVTIVEKRNQVGGRTSTIVQDGFSFDVGPTFFLYPKVLSEIFSSVGYDLESEVPMTRLDPHYRLVFGAGGELLATSDREQMERAIAAISPEDAKRFHEFISRNRTKLKKFLPFLQSSFESWKDLAKPEMIKLLPLSRRSQATPTIYSRQSLNNSKNCQVRHLHIGLGRVYEQYFGVLRN